MKKAFQLCESCNLQPSCPTGVALDSSECGKEIEIRTCKAYVQAKRIIQQSSRQRRAE